MSEPAAITCQYHGHNRRRTTGSPDERAYLRRAGWRDTIRYGWVCPGCNVRYADAVGRERERRLKGDLEK